MIHEFTTIVLTHLPFLLLMGAAAGFLAGLLGIGGGIVLVPCLFFGLTWLGYEPAHIMHMSVATAFAANVPTALSSIRAHWKKEAVRTDVIRKIAPGILLGVLTATYLADRMTGGTLQGIFAVCILLMAGSMLLNPARFNLYKEVPGQPWSGLAGFFMGGIAALMGIGGAIMTVPYMQFCQVPMHKAVGTAAALGFIIAAPALTGYILIGQDAVGLPPFSLGYVYVPAFIAIVPASVLAAPWGVKVAHALPVDRLRKIFALYLVLVSARMLYGLLGG